MRAQLRTYHAIPSLQANQDAHAYKQLQDAPRLKSILKGGAEDREEPNTLQKLKEMATAPRTNPVNLIFIMCAAAKKVADLHFPDGNEFHDVIMKTEYSSESRATAFLWLMWFHLESDFTEEGCDENPFGSGVDYGLGVANQGVPRLVLLTPEEKALENIDTEAEKEFGAEKQRTRAKILEMDQAFIQDRDTKRGKARISLTLQEEGPAILPRIRPSKHESDIDSTRSTPPPRGAGRGGTARRGVALKYQIFDGSSPARQGSEGVMSRKPRPPTAHQLAVERNRSQRVEYILDKGLRREHHKTRKIRRREGAIFRAHQRIHAKQDAADDSDSDTSPPQSLGAARSGIFRESGIGGLALLSSEKDDFGEEVSSYAAALRRSSRRLARWFGSDAGVVAPIKKYDPNAAKNGRGEDFNGNDDYLNGDMTMEDMDMDDVDGDETALGDGAEQTILADDEADRTEIIIDSDME